MSDTPQLLLAHHLKALRLPTFLRVAKRGKREFVPILRLLEVFRPEDVLAGVREAIAGSSAGRRALT